MDGTHGEHGQAADQELQVPALPEQGARSGPDGHARTLLRPLQRGPPAAHRGMEPAGRQSASATSSSLLLGKGWNHPIEPLGPVECIGPRLRPP